jgi:hypothetical protein
MPASDLQDARQCSKATSMYTINQTNSLYFFPHKLTFTAIEKASDIENRNRWFPGSDASVVLSRIQSLGQSSPSTTDAAPSKADVDKKNTRADRIG